MPYFMYIAPVADGINLWKSS